MLPGGRATTTRPPSPITVSTEISHFPLAGTATNKNKWLSAALLVLCVCTGGWENEKEGRTKDLFLLLTVNAVSLSMKARKTAVSILIFSARSEYLVPGTSVSGHGP